MMKLKQAFYKNPTRFIGNAFGIIALCSVALLFFFYVLFSDVPEMISHAVLYMIGVSILLSLLFLTITSINKHRRKQGRTRIRRIRKYKGEKGTHTHHC